MHAKDCSYSLRRLSFIFLLLGNVLNSGKSVAFGLRSYNVFDVLSKVGAALLGLPSMWALFAEQDFNLFESLATSLRVCEEELDGCLNTKYSEDYEKSPLDIDESGRNEESNGEIE